MIDQVISGVLAIWTDKICDRVKQRWGNVSIEGNAEIEASLPIVVSNTLVTTIKSWGQKAWQCEFGSGSDSDKDNPYLDEYINSTNFNHYRSKSDMSIRGRDKGVYKDLDGNEYESSGRNADRDLELKPVYKHMLPMHIIESEIDLALPELIEEIELAVGAEIARQLTIDIKKYV